LYLSFLELYEDLKRAAQDRKINTRKCDVLKQNGLRVNVNWRDIAVGDLIEIKQDESVPADVIIVNTGIEVYLTHANVS
jgi:P-type E1-E2 ATPase